MKNLVIIGGGFAGTKIAKSLQDNFSTTLIDTKDYFEFTPSILKVLTNPNYLSKIQSSHSSYLKKCDIVVGEIKNISAKHVEVNNKRINYDYLIISSGSDYAAPIKEKRISLVSRASHLLDSSKKLVAAKSVAIIGSGVVGIELAGEINSAFPDKKIIIYTSANEILVRNNKKTKRIMNKLIQEKNILLIKNRKINPSTDKNLAEHTFLCTGIKANSKFIQNNPLFKLNSVGQIKVNDFLQAKSNIFSAGDIVAIKEEKTAQTAQKHANIVVKNILNLERNVPLKKYLPNKLPMVISFGKTAIFEAKNFALKGKIFLLLKKIIEINSMIKH